MKRIDLLEDRIEIRNFGEHQIGGMKSIDSRDIIKKVNELIELTNEQQLEIESLKMINVALHNKFIQFSHAQDHPYVAQLSFNLANVFNQLRR